MALNVINNVALLYSVCVALKLLVNQSTLIQQQRRNPPSMQQSAVNAKWEHKRAADM